MAVPRDLAKVLPVITDLLMYLTVTPDVLSGPNVLPVIVPSVLAGDSCPKSMQTRPQPVNVLPSIRLLTTAYLMEIAWLNMVPNRFLIIPFTHPAMMARYGCGAVRAQA